MDAKWSLVSELRDIQSQFRSAELAQACLLVPVDEDGRVSAIYFGIPEIDAETGGLFVSSGLSAAVTMRLMGLWKRAGVALQRVPGMGVVAPTWRHILEMNPNPSFCWSAFLVTGPRIMFCEQMLPGTNFRIQDAARVSADAIDGLIADAVEKLEPGQPGHSRNKIPPKDVQEIFRMMKLKRWIDKNPIDVCRAYIKKEHKNASDEDIEKLASNLKRNLNRY